MAASFIKTRMRSQGRRSYTSLYLNPLNDLACRTQEEELSCWSEGKGKKPEEDDSGNSNSCSTGNWKDRRQRVLGFASRHRYHLSDVEKKAADPRMVEGSGCVWEDTGADTAPASSWSTLPKRSLMCRPLPPDIDRCSCYIIREKSKEIHGALLYSLYTHEGQGREDRKLAMARHRRKRGCSEFIVAQNSAGIHCRSDESFIGTIIANFMGSTYRIWDQFLAGKFPQLSREIVEETTCCCDMQMALLMESRFVPTMTTFTGSFRRMRVYIPKERSIQTKNPLRHSKGLPIDWKEDMKQVHQLFSKVPYYNKTTTQYELDFRERSRLDIHIQPSVKNFQLTIKGENRGQSVLLLGKIGKSKYVMEYRSPLTCYQAFAIALTSIDSKLCCSI